MDEKSGDPAKSYDFTLNNYNDKDIAMFASWAEKGEVSAIRISKEIGESGTPHLQGRVIFLRTYRIKQLKKLHGSVHWEDTKCTADNIYLLKKDSEVILDYKKERKGKEKNGILQKAIDAINGGCTLNNLWTEHQNAMVIFGRNLELLWNKQNITIVKAKFELKDFTFKPIIDWNTSHIFWGASGIGKTQFALAHFNKPLLVSHIDDLKTYNPEIHDGVVFDDMSFTHYPRTGQIHLLDIDQPRSIHIRYSTINIPANTKKIFTTNEEGGFIFLLEDEAIKRRVTVTRIAK